MAGPQTSTHTFKVAEGLSLTIDVTKSQNAPKNGIVVVHFHGGFLVVGDKTSFAPRWLIDACFARGWTYATASYRLMPETSGLEILSDTVSAVQWVRQNVSDRIIIAGASAGGYLALATAAHPECPRPLAVLCVYGMLDPASERYIKAGTPLRAPVTDLAASLEEINAAMSGGKAIDGYAFPANPDIDQRLTWISAIHEAAKFPDLLTHTPGLAGQIAAQGVSAIPEQHRTVFPVSFGLKPDFPPTVLLHGDDDVLVGFDQSASVAEKMKSLGIEVHLERAQGQDHGFDTKSDIDVDSEDAEGDDVAVKKSLRRVITALEEAVSKSAC